MDPLDAVSLASAVIQLADFSAKVMHKDKVSKLSRSAGTTLGEATLLDDAIANLSDLTQHLEKTRRALYEDSVLDDQDTADAQLITLAKDGGGVAKILQATLDQAKRNNDVDEQTVLARGLRSVLNLYYSQNTISALAKKIDTIRKQVDITLLASLRQNIAQAARACPKNRPFSADESAGPHVLLLESVQRHDWDPTDPVDVSAFSNTLKGSAVICDTESRFIRLILARLHFTGLHDRYRVIPCTHPGTSQWIFDIPRERTNTDEFDSFPQWLAAKDCNNVHWISGKPGTGKSTLMKFISSHRRTTAQLHAWGEERLLVKGSFFFSSLGGDMQKSHMGLLRTLLHSALKGDRTTLIQVFHRRWQQFLAFGGGRQPFTWLELRQAFMVMVSTPITPTSFFFAIDGLDECDGNPRELLQLIRDLAKYPHVKICIASRSSPELLRAFKDKPCLRLERFNRQDIYNYVKASLTGDNFYLKLNKMDSSCGSEVVRSITKKAAGIFLWAHVVVQLLLDELSNTARMSSLLARLEALPSGIEPLYTKLLSSLSTEHLKHACELFRLITVKPHPLLLELWFADSNNDDPALRNKARPLLQDEIFERLDLMNRRLISRRRGLLETESQRGNSRPVLSKSSQVTWTHRIVKEFVRSQRVWNVVLDNTGHDAFDPEWHWANGQLGLLKTLAGSAKTKTSQFTSCIEYALRLESRLKICPVKFLDEVGRTAAIYPNIYDDLVPRKVRGTVDSFLEFAVLFNLASYVRTRGSTLPREDLLRASRLLGLLDAKQWGAFMKRFDHPGVWNVDLEERKKEMHHVMNILLDRGGGGSRWQRAKKRLSGQRKT